MRRLARHLRRLCMATSLLFALAFCASIVRSFIATDAFEYDRARGAADGSIEAFHDEALEDAIHGLAERLGVTLTGHDIVLHAARRT